MIWPCRYAFQVTFWGNHSFASTENPTFAEETGMDNLKNNKRNLASRARARGSGSDQTADPTPSGCFLPSLPASPLLRPASCHQFSVVTGSHCTAAWGPLWGSLQENGPELFENAGRPDGGQRPSLPRLLQKEELRFTVLLPLDPFSSLRSRGIKMRWKCWDSSPGSIANNSNLGHLNEGRTEEVWRNI